MTIMLYCSVGADLSADFTNSARDSADLKEGSPNFENETLDFLPRSTHFSEITGTCVPGLLARFSNCDFWNLGEILDRYRWKDFYRYYFSLNFC